MIRKWVDEINTASVVVFTGTSVISGALVYLFGPWNKVFAWLIIFMGADLITGIITAIVKKSAKTEDGKFSSAAGTVGLFKKIGVLICVMVAYGGGTVFLPTTEEALVLRDAVICGFAFFEVASIFENLDRLGVKFPPVLIKFVKKIKKKVYAEETTNPSDESLSDAEAANDEKEEEIELFSLGKDEGDN